MQEIKRRDPWVGKVPWRRKWQPFPLFSPGKSHGQRSLSGYNLWGQKRLETKRLSMQISNRKQFVFCEPIILPPSPFVLRYKNINIFQVSVLDLTLWITNRSTSFISKRHGKTPTVPTWKTTLSAYWMQAASTQSCACQLVGSYLPESQEGNKQHVWTFQSPCLAADHESMVKASCPCLWLLLNYRYIQMKTKVSKDGVISTKTLKASSR